MNVVEEVQQKLDKKINKFFKKNEQRYYIDIDAKEIVPSAKIMFRDIECRFAIATGTHTPQGFEILYHFSHDKTGKIFSLRVALDKNAPEIESITSIITGAEWIEREMWEMLGINFKNHPNLKRLLLAPDFPEGVYPLRQKPRE
ncbi:MAG: hypothetical protein AUJ85_08115 [Elusimicrobia bacterium CG1_02_37_114]|nr:MAG: hypothetical protein AUJ85_08115 [Elusimicrobia bacterium CG1_02_37_114]PIV52963.1 MAG: hypothetical protein COS17_06395 [Elusimicrobia bacterium CG02_land_8_20_14_3_00_37_13]PIZ13779.1 MAG: hypothetical protein COY53_03035 [Elusimicrobia bacterium CG_4_10_14_0_8_um_filter_37_32]